MFSYPHFDDSDKDQISKSTLIQIQITVQNNAADAASLLGQKVCQFEFQCCQNFVKTLFKDVVQITVFS